MEKSSIFAPPGCPWKRRSLLRPLAPKALMPVSRTVLCDLWMFSGQSSWDLRVSGWVLLVSFLQVAGWFWRMRPWGSRDTSRTTPPSLVTSCDRRLLLFDKATSRRRCGMMGSYSSWQWVAGWWFQTVFMFTPTWGNDPIWLIFFKWVETTN